MKNIFIAYTYDSPNREINNIVLTVEETENVKIDSADIISFIEKFIELKNNIQSVKIINFRRME